MSQPLLPALKVYCDAETETSCRDYGEQRGDTHINVSFLGGRSGDACNRGPCRPLKNHWLL